MSVTEKLAEIDRRQQAIERIGPLANQVKQRINYRFRLDWNYYSNRMEGGTLTREETRSIMVGNLDVHRKPIKDVIEMNGHDRVVRELLRIGSGEVRLSEKRITDIHRAIMHEEDSDKRRQIGRWKEQANEIINYQGEKINFCPPQEVAARMHDLLNRTNAGIDYIERGKRPVPHPLLLASDFHIDYLTIHPFYDGNGRTARILTNLLLIARGFPPIVLTDQDKAPYYRYLSDIQTHSSDRNLFYDFISDLMLRSVQLVQDAIDGKDVDNEDDVEKELTLIAQQLRFIPPTGPSESSERIKSVIYSSIFPVFEELQNKLRPFAKLFKGFSPQIRLNNVSLTTDKPSTVERLREIIETEEIQTLKCYYAFHDLQSTSNASVSMGIAVDVALESEKYVVAGTFIDGDGKEQFVGGKEQAYDQTTTVHAYDGWIEDIRRTMLNALKALAENKQNK